MSIHNPLGKLQYFPDMPDKKYVGKAEVYGIIQQLSYIVAARNAVFRINAPLITRKVDTVIPEKCENMLAAGGSQRIHLNVYCIDKRLFAHGLNNTRCP